MMNRYLCPMVCGISMAYIFLLLMVFSGSGFALTQGGSETPEEVNKKFEKEFAEKKLRAEQGDPQAQYEWGIDCIYRQKSTAADGLHWLLAAAAQGHVGAEAQAGICYAGGLGTEKNADEAVRLLLHAASKGDMYALQQLGSLSIEGFGPLPKDLKQAEKYFLEAIEKGNAAADRGLQYVRKQLKKEEAAHSDGKPTP